MNCFRKLPGFTRTPAGLETRILRKLPAITIFGTIALVLPSLVVRLLEWGNISHEALARIGMVAGVVVLHWTVVFTAAISAFIVYVMKGPAYVADAYALVDADKPAGEGRPTT
ncbi:conserved protein of unknown function [Thauera humireducens]|nr:conserved protein of unknown function [Thauera humireducens]